MLTKFWELFHLLFIGIAVAYGLFSRRNVEPDLETHSPIIDNTPSYVSKMFPVSSIFVDECENPCGSDENRMTMMHSWNYSLNYESSSQVGGQYKTQFPIPDDNFSDVRYDGTNVVQAWNSEYYHSEPVVVVAQPYCTIGECDEIVGYKPLGLPVRSLRSTARDLDSSNDTNESDSSFGSRGSSRNSVSSDRRFRDLSPYNLEQNVNDASGSTSPIPWQRSRSRKMRSEENHGMFSDAAESTSIPWQELSKRMEIEENHEEFYDVAGSSPIPRQARSRRMESEENCGTVNDVAGSASPGRWQESCRRMEIEENHDSAGSASPMPWQTRSRIMESEENLVKFNNAAGSASPIPLHSSSRRITSEENHGSVTHPSHFRPLSVDDTKFESLSSRTFRSTSFSSHTSSYSSSDSISSDNVNFEAEEMGQKKTSNGSSSENMNMQEEDLGENTTSHGSSPRFRKMETREKYAAVSRPSHFRPMSVDETQFESLGSRSLMSTRSFSSQTSLFSSLDSGSSENINLPKEGLGEKKSSHGSSSSSPSPPARRRNGEASSQALHSRGYIVGSLLRDDMKSSLKDDLMGLNGKRSKDPSYKKESGLHFVQSNTEKPASLAKAPSKGKSVRTRRPSGLTSEMVKTGDKQADEVEKMPDNVESVLTRRQKLRQGGPDHLFKGINKQNTKPSCPKPEVTFSDYHKGDKQESSKNASREDSFTEPENFQMSSDEDRVSECANDSGLDSEVDKKASEFIAKFKAQIRLQKEASMDRSRGLRTMKKILGET